MHDPAQVGLRRLHQQVIVVIHQHVGVNPRAGALVQLAEQFQKVVTVGIVPEGVFAFVAASGDALPPPGPFNAEWARHEVMPAAVSSNFKRDLSK